MLNGVNNYDEKSNDDSEQGLQDMVNTYGYETCGVRLTTITLNEDE